MWLVHSKQPNIVLTGCAHLSNQIICFSIELFTFQVTLKMKTVLIWLGFGLTFYMTKPDMTLHTFTLHTYCYVELVLTWNRSFTGICSRYPGGDNSSFYCLAGDASHKEQILSALISRWLSAEDAWLEQCLSGKLTWRRPLRTWSSTRWIWPHMERICWTPTLI